MFQFGYVFCYSDDGRFLAISSGVSSGGLRTELWDGFALTKLDQFSGLPMALKFSPGGSLLAVGDYEGNVVLWDAVTRHEVTRWKAHRSAVRGLSFSRDGKILVTCGDDQAIHLWEPATQRRLSTLTGHQKRILGISLSPDGQTLASASDDGTIKFWNLSSTVKGKELKQTLTPLWFSQDGRVIATIDTNLTVHHWDVVTRGQIRAIPSVVEPKTVNNVCMALDGKTVAIGRTNAAIELWNLESRERIATLPNHGKQVLGLIFSPDQRWLFSAHFSPNAGPTYEGRLWNLATRQTEARFPICFHAGIAFSPDSKILATMGTNRTVQLSDVATGLELRTLKGDASYALAFSPNGKLLAIHEVGFLARIWEVSSGKEIAVMSGHAGAILDVAFSPDGKTLATGSSDGTVKFWNTATWQELMTLPDYGKKVSRLMFSPDGSTLAVGSALGDNEPGPVQLWRAPSLTDIDAAEQRKTE